jgi:hypothetical protein
MKIIKGDSFLLALVAKVDGVPQDLTGWDVRSSIQLGQTLKLLTVDVTDMAAGEYLLSADTSDWPTGVHKFDIRYTTDAGQVLTTEAISVQVARGVTP